MFQFELHTYSILVGHRNIQKELYLWIQDAKCLYCWSKALFSITGNRLIQLLWEFTNGGLRYYRGPRIFNPRTIFPQPNGATYNLSVPTGVLGCGCCAADVVSSPGGWTQCLAAHCSSVISIDWGGYVIGLCVLMRTVAEKQPFPRNQFRLPRSFQPSWFEATWCG